MNKKSEKQVHSEFFKSIPKWILPTTYTIIAFMLLLTLHVLNLIPYEQSVSNTVIIYNDKAHGVSDAYGEILLSDISGINVGDFVEFVGYNSNKSHVSYEGHVKDIVYDRIRNHYVIKIVVSQGYATNLSDYPIKGVARIHYKTDTLLKYLADCVKQLFN
ncbi:MAG: hypothetical protein IJ421_09815 [Prevotella sp.]|nr:hypothetical protein [Prevotella sp.]